jgi:hypothetical protein
MSKSKLVRLYANNARMVEDGLFEAYIDSNYLSNVRSIALKSCIFNNNVPNIQTIGARKNNVFEYQINGGFVNNYQILAEGFYTASDIATLLQTELDAQAKLVNPAATVVVVVDDNSKKFVFTPTGVTLNLRGDLIPASLNRAIGNTIDSGVINSGLAYTVDSYANLAGLQSVAVAVRSKSPKTLIHLNPNQGFFTNSLSVIPVDVPWTFNQTFINPDLKGSVLVFSLTESLVKLRFSIRDIDGQLIPNQAPHFVVEVAITYD